MANRKVKIEFEATGINNILEDLARLKASAAKVHVSDRLDDQLEGISAKIGDIIEQIGDMQTALDTPKNTKGNKAFTDMEKKIADLKKGAKSLFTSLQNINTKLDKELEKIDKAFDKINDQDLGNLKMQLDGISMGFDTLISQALEYRRILSQKISVPASSLKKMAEVSATTKKGTSQADREGNPQIKELENVVSLLEEKLNEKSDYQRGLSEKSFNNTLERLAKDFNMYSQSRLTTGSARGRGQIDSQLLSIVRQFEQYMKAPEYEGFRERLDTSKVVYERLMKVMTSADFSDYMNNNVIEAQKSNLEKQKKDFNALNALIAFLQNDIRQIRAEIDTLSNDPNSMSNQINQVVSQEAKRAKKDKTITLTVGFRDDAEADLTAQLRQIVDNINTSIAASPVEVKVDFVGRYKGSEQTKMAKTLQETMDKLAIEDNPEMRAQLQKTIDDVADAFKGDLKIKVTSNIEDIQRELPGAVKALRAEFRKPVDLRVKPDIDYLQKELNKVTNLVLPIGNIELSKDAYDRINFTKTLEEEQMEFARQQEGTQEKVARSFSKSLRTNIMEYIAAIKEIPQLWEGIEKTLTEVNVTANAQFNEKQVQAALNQLKGLSVRISRIDMYQPTIDRLKLDVKQDTLKMIDTEGALVRALHLLSNNLTPFLDNIQQEEGVKGSNKNLLAKRLLELNGTMKTLNDSLELLQKSVKQLGKVEFDPESLKSMEISFKDLPDLNSLANAFEDVANTIKGVVEPDHKVKPVKATTVDKRSTEQEEAHWGTVDTIQQDTSNLSAIKADLEAIKTKLTGENALGLNISREDIQGIIDAINTPQTKTQDNSFIRALLGWVKASNVMSKIKVEQTEDGITTKKGIDYERQMYANSKTGETILEHTIGLEDKIPRALDSAVSKLAKAINPDFDVHSHPHDYVTPSADHNGSGDLYTWRGTTGKKLIVGRKQMAMFDYDVLKNQTKEAYDSFALKYREKTIKETLKMPAFQELLKRTAREKRNDSVAYGYQWTDALSQKLINAGAVNPDTSVTQLSDWIIKKYKNSDIGFGFNDPTGVAKTLTAILKDLKADKSNKLTNAEIDGIVSKLVTEGFEKNGLFTFKQFGQRYNNGKDDFQDDQYGNMVRVQMLKEAFESSFKGVKFEDFFKNLNYDMRNLTPEMLSEFTGSPMVLDQQEVTNNILRDINANVAEIAQRGVQLAPKAEEEITGPEKGSDSPSNSKEDSRWYKKFFDDSITREHRYSKRLDKAFNTYQKEFDFDLKSDPTYMLQFYDEYVQYLDEDIERATKGEKQSKRKYKKYVTEQRKLVAEQKKEQDRLNAEKIQLEKDKNNLADADNEAFKKSQKLMESRDARQNELAQRIATRQQAEYGRQQLQADEIAWREKAKGKKQEETEYISNNARQKNITGMQGKLDKLLNNPNLTDDARQQVEKLSQKLEEVSNQTRITKTLFSDIELEVENVIRDANIEIQKNEQLNAQKQQQLQLEKSTVAEQEKINREKEKQEQLERTEARRQAEIASILRQMQNLSSNPFVDSLTKSRIEDFIPRLKQVQQEGNIARDVLADMKKEANTLNKQGGSEIRAQKQLMDKNAQANAKANADRMKQINAYAEQTDELLSNENFAMGARSAATELAEQFKQFQQTGKITEDEFDDIQQKFVAMNKQAQTSIDRQKTMNKLLEEMSKFEAQRQRGTDKKLFTDSYLSDINAVKTAMQNKIAGGLEITEEDVARARAQVQQGKNPSLAILRANKTTLQKYITRGEKMLATNYLPGNVQAELKQVVAEMRALELQTDASQESAYRLADAFRKVEMEAAKSGKTLWGQVGQRLQDMNAKFIATYFSFMDIIRYMRAMISTITELDTALTEMRKVSDETLASLKEYQQTTFDTASALGTTAVQLQQSTADWMRLGESMQEASKSAVAATTLLNVSEFENINEATTALVAMSQAYKELDKTEIIDVMNNIGNNYAIATDQLATALQASASALVTQGNDLYEAAALVTAGNQVLQDASKTGTGIRTISLRIAGMKLGKEELESELAELGEEVDDWVVQTESKKREAIMKYTAVASNGGKGVDILDSNGNLKDTYHIMLEISKVYKEIQEEDKKYGTNRAQALVEELAGKVRSNVAASILLNPEVLEDVYESAKDSAGSAAEENAKYLDSIVGKTQQFKNELQELEQNALDSEMLKDFLDFGTSFLDTINQLDNAIPKLIALLGSLALSWSTLKKEQNAGLIKFNKQTNSFGLFGKDIRTFYAPKISAAMTTDIGSMDELIDQFEDSISRLPKSMQSAFDSARTNLNNFKNGFVNVFSGINFNDENLKKFYAKLGDGGDFDETLKSMTGMTDETKRMAYTLQNQGVVTLDQFTAASKTAGTAAKMLSTAINLINMAVRTLVLVGITIAITKIVQLFHELAEAGETAERNMKEFSTTMDEVTRKAKEQRKYLEENAEEFIRLSEGVSATGDNLTLTNEEFGNYQTMSKELADMFPTLIQGWTDTGEAILNVKDGVESLTEAYREESQAALAAAMTGTGDSSLQSSLDYFRELNKINIAEGVGGKIKNVAGQIKNIFSGKKEVNVTEYEAGKNITFDELYDAYDAFLKMSYQDYVEIQEKLVDSNYATLDTLNENQRKFYNESMSKNIGLYGIGYAGATEEEFNAAYKQVKAKKKVLDSTLQEGLSSISKYALNSMMFEDSYEDLSDSAKKLANTLVKDINLETVRAFEDDPVQVEAWVENIYEEIERVGQMKGDPLGQLMNLDRKDTPIKDLQKDIDDLWSQVSEVVQDADVEQSIWESLGFDEDVTGEANKLANSIQEIARSEQDLATLEEFTNSFTANQIELWLSETNALMSATEAMDAFNEAFNKQSKYKIQGFGTLLSQDGYVNAGQQVAYEGALTRYNKAQEKGDVEAMKSALADLNELSEKGMTWGDIRDELVGIAQEGKLDEDTLKKYRYFDNILQALGIDAEDAEDSLKEMVEVVNKIATQSTIDDLDNYKQGIDHLDSAYQQYKKGKLIDATMLNDIQSTFGKLDAYGEFEEAVLSGTKNLQPFFDAIVNEYAMQEKALEGLNEENKKWVEQQLVASGITKQSAHDTVEGILAEKRALEDNVRSAIVKYNTLAQATTGYTIDVTDLNDVTAEQVDMLIKTNHQMDLESRELDALQGELSESERAIVFFTLKKELAKDMRLRNDNDIEYLLQLIKLAGIGGEAISRMKSLIKNYDTYQTKLEDAKKARDDLLNGRKETQIGGGEQTRLQQLQSTVDQYQTLVDEVDTWQEDTLEELNKKYSDLDYTTHLKQSYGGAIDSNKQAAEDALQKAKETLDKILAMYDAELDAGVVSFQTYVDKSRAIIQQYYDQGKIKAQDYYDYLANLYEKQVSQYDKVISAVQKKIQDETDSLEKQKENVEKSYNDQIEVIQKKIDALQEENDEIDRNMELSKAQYELARARNQRTRLMYSEARGFYYEADLKGISDAEDNVRKAKMNKETAEYEKQIKSLQEAMKSETDTINEQIKKLNEYSQKWGEVSSKLENAINEQRAAEILGQNWEADILTQRQDVLEEFTNKYVELQQKQKQAYLDARQAEANAPVSDGVGGGGSGTTSSTKTGSNPKVTPTPDTNPDPPKTDTDTPKKTSYWQYNGQKFQNEFAANSTRNNDRANAGKTAYDSYLRNHGYNSSAPYAVQKPLLEGAEKAKNDALSAFDKDPNKKIIRANFGGTDSAKPGESLVGEIKPEIVLHKNGTASIVDKPTLMDLQGGEKIFNGDETEKILKSKYKPLSSVNPSKFKMLHAFAGGTTSPMQKMIAAQAVGIASGMKSGIMSTSNVGGQTINVTYNVSLPNITDSSKATDLFNEFQQLSMKATQYFKRRD